MKNSELYQLAFQCLVNDGNSGFVNLFRNNILPNDELLSKFIRLSSNHLILPAVYRRLQKTGLSNDLPPDLALHLNEILQLNIKRNEEILHQIDEINLHLNSAGIEPVYLKGTANLLDDLYSNPADIEIHRLPVIPLYADWFVPEKVFNEKKQIPDKINYYVPSDKHKLIQNFIHSQLTNKGHKHRLISLRDLYDCHLLLKKVSRNEILNEIKQREKAEIYFDFHESLLKRDFDISESDAKSKRFIVQHHWFMNHPRTHYYCTKLLKSKELITNRFLKAFVNKTVFKNLVVRITKREWWQKRLFAGLKEYFS